MSESNLPKISILPEILAGEKVDLHSEYVATYSRMPACWTISLSTDTDDPGLCISQGYELRHPDDGFVLSFNPDLETSVVIEQLRKMISHLEEMEDSELTSLRWSDAVINPQ